MTPLIERIADTPGPKNDRERIALCVGLANVLARWAPAPSAHDIARGIHAVMRSQPGTQIEVFSDEDVDRLMNYIAVCAGVEPKDLTPWLLRATPQERMKGLGRALLCGSIEDEPKAQPDVAPSPAPEGGGA